MSKIDRNKKYEGLGLTWVFVNGLFGWASTSRSESLDLRDAVVNESTMQDWLDAGHITPVRTTKIVTFDVRSYCKRLAKADPERIELLVFGSPKRAWGIRDRRRRHSCFCDNEDFGWWAFIGPLADELLEAQEHVDYENDGPGYALQYSFSFRAHSSMSLLEATFAAVVERLEQPHAKV